MLHILAINNNDSNNEDDILSKLCKFMTLSKSIPSLLIDLYAQCLQDFEPPDCLFEPDQIRSTEYLLNPMN